MKRSALQIVLLFSALFFILPDAVGQSRKKNKEDENTRNWRYEIEGVQTGVQGTYLIKVWTYSKRPDLAIEQAKKNAVHGVIFQKGFWNQHHALFPFQLNL
ncbi:MAG: hypothetical protein PHU00_10390, partial [Bacteroidales bacterium]|nr:hypothetical protein [Bacteroidales bacterium]